MSQSRLRESMHTYCERACTCIAREPPEQTSLISSFPPTSYILHPIHPTSAVREPPPQQRDLLDIGSSKPKPTPL